MSRSNQLIEYAPPSENPLISHSAPSLEDILAGRKRKPSSTKVVTRKSPVQGSSSQQALLSVTPSSAQVADTSVVDIPDTPPGNYLILLIPTPEKFSISISNFNRISSWRSRWRYTHRRSEKKNRFPRWITTVFSFDSSNLTLTLPPPFFYTAFHIYQHLSTVFRSEHYLQHWRRQGPLLHLPR